MFEMILMWKDITIDEFIVTGIAGAWSGGLIWGLSWVTLND